MAGFHIPDDLADSLTWIWCYHPTFSAIINTAPLTFVVEDTDEYKAQVQGRLVMFSLPFIVDCNDYKAVAGVMMHETMHYMMNHSELHFGWFTAKEITGKLQNGNLVTCPYHPFVVQHALDFSINDALIKMGVTLPADRLHDPYHIGGWLDSEADIYVRVYTQYLADGTISKLDQGDQGALQPGQGGSDAMPYDPHTPGNDPGHKTEIVRKELTKHAIQKGQGRSAGEIEKLLARIAPRRFPWVEVVRPRFQHLLGRTKPTWRRPDRPGMAMRTILAGREGNRAGKTLLIADTSGSIGHREQENFIENTMYLMEDCRPKELVFLEIDARVRRVTRVKNIHELRNFIQPMREGREGLYGGGGTDMREAWTWMRQENYIPDIVLILTDGYTPFPEDISPAGEVVWIMTTEVVAPAHAGRTARMFID